MRWTLNQPNGQQFWALSRDVVFRHSTEISHSRPVESVVVVESGDNNINGAVSDSVEYYSDDFVKRKIPSLNRLITNQLSSKALKSQSSGPLSKLYADLKHANVSTFKLDQDILDKIFPENVNQTSGKVPEWLDELSKRYTVYAHISENPIQFYGSQVVFRPTENHNNEDIIEFGLRHTDEIDLLLKMVGWCRTQSPQFTGFMANLKKALALGSSSAKRQNHNQGPNNPFNQDSDRIFLQAIVAHAFIKDPICRSPYDYIVQSILRPLYYYTDSSGAARLLNDIKVVVPWDFRDFVVEKALQACTAGHSILAQRQQERLLMNRVTGNLASIGLTANEAEQDIKFQNEDVVASKRVDFGTMECYTIDSADTVDVDDAISIEPCSNGADEVWVHVHVADPTVLVKPNSAYWDFALNKSSSCYLAEETIHMMHPTLTRAFSLEPKRSNYTMTISAKLSLATGSILDFKIQPGVIRNVIKWNYANLDQMVNNRWSLPSPFTVDFSNTNWHTDYPSFDGDVEMMDSMDKRKDVIATLLKISGMLRQNRLQSVDDALVSVLTKAEPKLKSKQSSNGFFELKPRLSRALPEIKFDTDMQHLSPARQLVSEFMILGGELMARYANERKIPAIFRNQESLLKAHQNDEAKLKFIENILQTHPDKIIPPEISLLLLGYYSASTLSTISGAHGMLGVQNYCQATSPIRRASDLISHWQVKQSFLDGSGMPVSKEQVDDLLPRLLVRERQTKKMQRANASHWSKIYLTSRSDEGETFDGYMFENAKSLQFASVFIKQVGQRLLIPKTNLKPGYEHEVGCWIRVRAEMDIDKGRVAGYAAATTLQQV